MRSKASVDTPRFKCRGRAHVKVTSKRMTEKARCQALKKTKIVAHAFTHKRYALDDLPGSVATTMIVKRNTRKAHVAP